MNYIVHVIVGKDLSLLDISYLIFENEKKLLRFILFIFFRISKTCISIKKKRLKLKGYIIFNYKKI